MLQFAGVSCKYKYVTLESLWLRIHTCKNMQVQNENRQKHLKKKQKKIKPSQKTTTANQLTKNKTPQILLLWQTFKANYFIDALHQDYQKWEQEGKPVQNPKMTRFCHFILINNCLWALKIILNLLYQLTNFNVHWSQTESPTCFSYHWLEACLAASNHSITI